MLPSTSSCHRLLLVATAFFGTTVHAPAAALRLEGFGASTTGGANGNMVAVTNLDDSGTGSLRSALASGNRRIVFKIGGTIRLKSPLMVEHARITIDGATAPSPGMVISQRPFIIRDTHDVIVRHLRFRESNDDNLRISGGCRRIVIDHCSSSRAGDGAIDITKDYKSSKQPQDITISWCLIAGTEKAMLLAYAGNLSLHHNLFTNNGQRNPQVQNVQNFDFRNNLVRHWTIYGMRVRDGSTGNIVACVFARSARKSKRDKLALIVVRGPSEKIREVKVFIADNVGTAKFNPNTLRSTKTRFKAPQVTIVPTSRLRETLREGVGARPLDAIDKEFLDRPGQLMPRSAQTK